LASSTAPIIFTVGSWLTDCHSPKGQLASNHGDWPTRRSVPAASAAAGTVSLLPMHFAAAAGAGASNQGDSQMATTEADAIRPFSINVPEEDLVDLRRRIAATRWPDKETVSDSSQGIQLGNLQQLLRYWGTDYDWRKAEARLNALPQFMTEIDGLDIHFIHVRSKHPNALPVIITRTAGRVRCSSYSKSLVRSRKRPCRSFEKVE